MRSNFKTIVRDVVVICPALKDPQHGRKLVGLPQFVSILASLSKHVFIIGGNYFESISDDNVNIINIRSPLMKSYSRSYLLRLIRSFSNQLALSGALIKLSLRRKNTIDTVFIFTSETSLLITMICKLMRKKTLLILRGSILRGKVGAEKKISYDLLYGMLLLARRLTLGLIDGMVVYTQGVIIEWNLKKYKNKIFVAPYFFLDFDKFKLEKPLHQRENIIGYIGRLSSEKGILNFMQALPILLQSNLNMTILIVGDGELQSEVEKFIDNSHIKDKVKFVGMVNHEEIPEYLNRLKLVVMPSYSEGLPNLILEAIACGTPVLATPVGSIPDIIKDSQNGFIMEDNSAESIAQNIIRAMNYPDLEEISKNARTFVEKEYYYEAAINRYRILFRDLIGSSAIEN